MDPFRISNLNTTRWVKYTTRNLQNSIIKLGLDVSLVDIKAYFAMFRKICRYIQCLQYVRSVNNHARTCNQHRPRSC